MSDDTRVSKELEAIAANTEPLPPINPSDSDSNNKARTPQYLSAADMIVKYPELHPPIIEGLLREGETMNVIAAPKMGKSWLALDLALAVATGRVWLNRFPTTQKDVLVIDYELHPPTYAKRIPLVAEKLGITIEEYGDHLFVESLRGRLMDFRSFKAYFDRIEPGRFGLIVIDAFYRTLPVDTNENDNAAITDLYNQIDSFAEQLHCSFVLIHHTSKGSQTDKAITDVGSGAGSQSRAADTHLIIRPHENDGAVVLSAVTRSFPAPDTLCLRHVHPIFLPAPDLDPTKLKSTRRKASRKDSPETPTIETIVKEFVTEEPALRNSIIERIRNQYGISEKKAKGLVSEAEEKGLIHRWGSGANRPVKIATLEQPKE